VNYYSVKLIQVPFELIINKQKYKSEVMYLYIHLKMVCKNENVNIYAKKLFKNLEEIFIPKCK